MLTINNKEARIEILPVEGIKVGRDVRNIFKSFNPGNNFIDPDTWGKIRNYNKNPEKFDQDFKHLVVINAGSKKGNLSVVSLDLDSAISLIEGTHEVEELKKFRVEISKANKQNRKMLISAIDAQIKTIKAAQEKFKKAKEEAETK